MDNSEKILSIAVVMPAFNEEEIIKRSIALLSEKLNEIAIDYEIIVVDDCSNDNTLKIINKLALEMPELRIIHNDKNLGLGGSLRRGFSLASKKLVFYTDADLPIDYQDIYKAKEIMDCTNADLVSGFRYSRGKEPIYRIINSFIYNKLVSFLFNIRIKDINFAAKLIKREALEKLNLGSIDGVFIGAEMVIKASYLGYKIEQFGVNYFSRTEGYSKLGKPKYIFKTLIEILKLYMGIVDLNNND